MGTNQSKKIRTKSWDQQQRTNEHKPTHPLNRPQWKPIRTINVNMNDINNRVSLYGENNFGQLIAPIILPPVSNKGINSVASSAPLRRETVAYPTVGKRRSGSYTGPMHTAGHGRGSNQVIQDIPRSIKPIEREFWSERAMQTYPQNLIINQTLVNPMVTEYDSSFYRSLYPNEVHSIPYVYDTPEVYPIIYPTSNFTEDEFVWVEPQNISFNNKDAFFLNHEHQHGNAILLPVEVYNSSRSTLMSTVNNGVTDNIEKYDPAEEKRKLALKKLLIRPIIRMKGVAWDEKEWKDFNTPHSFHAACRDFLRIIELSKEKKMAFEIKDFLTSDLLTPRYNPEHHQLENDKRLNHFHVFWNLMHQLPFAVQQWNKETAQKLNLFYKVWVAVLLRCNYCRAHYLTWIDKYPPLVTDRVSLSQWLFRLHNDVNQRTSKPLFLWAKYNQRWGPSDPQSPKQKDRNSRSDYLQKTSSLEKSNHSRNSSYGSTSFKRKINNTRSRSAEGLDLDSEIRTATPSEFGQQKYSLFGFESNVSQSCFFSKKINLPRSRVNKQRRLSLMTI